MIDYLMDRYSDITSVKTNTIDDDLVQFVKEIPDEYVAARSYSYGIDPTNNIFTNWVPRDGASEMNISLNGLTQRYIAELKTVEGFSRYPISENIIGGVHAIAIWSSGHIFIGDFFNKLH